MQRQRSPFSLYSTQGSSALPPDAFPPSFSVCFHRAAVTAVRLWRDASEAESGRYAAQESENERRPFFDAFLWSFARAFCAVALLPALRSGTRVGTAHCAQSWERRAEKTMSNAVLFSLCCLSPFPRAPLSFSLYVCIALLITERAHRTLGTGEAEPERRRKKERERRRRKVFVCFRLFRSALFFFFPIRLFRWAQPYRALKAFALRGRDGGCGDQRRCRERERENKQTKTSISVTFSLFSLSLFLSPLCRLRRRPLPSLSTVLNAVVILAHISQVQRGRIEGDLGFLFCVTRSLLAPSVTSPFSPDLPSPLDSGLSPPPLFAISQAFAFSTEIETRKRRG